MSASTIGRVALSYSLSYSLSCSLLFSLLALTTLAHAADVADTCAACHPPLAMSDDHPAVRESVQESVQGAAQESVQGSVQGYGLDECRRCHEPGTQAGAALLRAMHTSHIEDMGFDCTLCHVDAEDDVPRLRVQLDSMLTEPARAQ